MGRDSKGQEPETWWLIPEVVEEIIKGGGKHIKQHRLGEISHEPISRRK